MTTDWLTFLASRGATIETERVRDFGDPTAERQATATGEILADVGTLRSIEATGADAGEFLHGQFSCDVRGLPEGRSVYGSYSTAKGRMLATFLLWREPSGLQLLLPRSILPAVLKRLRMFVLRAKVTLSDRSAERVMLGASGPGARAALETAKFSVPVERHGVTISPDGTVLKLDDHRFLIALHPGRAAAVWTLLSAQLRPVGSPCWEWLDVAAGVPYITAPTQEQLVPQMANLELIGGVSFSKGCYPGQEIVARTHYLGNVKRRMFLAHVAHDAAPKPGDALFSEDVGHQTNGLIVNAAPAPDGGFDVLAVVQSASAAESRVHLAAPDGPVLRFRPLPYAVE